MNEMRQMAHNFSERSRKCSLLRLEDWWFTKSDLVPSPRHCEISWQELKISDELNISFDPRQFEYLCGVDTPIIMVMVNVSKVN